MDDADLPPEFKRMREQDHAMLMQRLKQESLTGEEARKHARSELRERDELERGELRTPGAARREPGPDWHGRSGPGRVDAPPE